MHHNYYFHSFPFSAVVRNDTITSDPLYTVPFGIWNLNLCYEIHGKPNTIFNLISDTCVNVNAQYTAVNTSNIIDSIAIRAQGDSKTCRDIRVDLEGCAAFASQLGGGGSLVQLTGMLEEDGISVRPYSNRVRIAVPNCNNLRLVMWAICEPTTPGIPSHIRFHVSRGVNLSPTSHGLLGKDCVLSPVYFLFSCCLGKAEGGSQVQINNWLNMLKRVLTQFIKKS